MTSETPVSAIRGYGHGSAHSWLYLFSPDVGSAPAFCKFARYECRDCYAVFNHYYDMERDVFAAMKKANISATCFNLQEYVDKRRLELQAAEPYLREMFGETASSESGERSQK